MTEDETRQVLEENERNTIMCVCGVLRDYGKLKHSHLVEFIASLCGVDVKEILSSSKDIDTVHARWMYFYACRYMTNETYEKIGKYPLEMNGKSYTPTGVAACIDKMYSLMENQPIWRKRWTIIKRIIKESNGTLVEPPTRMTITVPKNVELTIKKE